MADELDKLAHVVPEFFFDIIARVVPGAVFLLLCLWHLAGEKLDFGTTMGVLFAAYVIGICADVLSSVVQSVIESVLNRLNLTSYVQDSAIWGTDLRQDRIPTKPLHENDGGTSNVPNEPVSLNHPPLLAATGLRQPGLLSCVCWGLLARPADLLLEDALGRSL